MKKNRILVISLGHPDFSLGGAETASYNLFNFYRDSNFVDKSWYLARVDSNRPATGKISPYRKDEYLWEQSLQDAFFFKAESLDSAFSSFIDLIKTLKPNIIHTHHYIHLGLEYIQLIKKIDSSIKIIMTLHEFSAICHHHGQMIKTNDFRLCYESSIENCNRCFPEKTIEQFWLRKHRIMHYFSLIDHFTSPSNFLMKRYIDWGMNPKKISVIENIHKPPKFLEPRAISEVEFRNRFGFFGQINPYKGLDVLLVALHEMPKKQRKKIVLEVHGANLGKQDSSFQNKIISLRDPLIEEGVVKWIGPYQPHELENRMRDIDWVCMPSIWWENSPMIIQEALNFGRPVLVSDIGGMAEKIKNNQTGLHISAGNTKQWADCFQKLPDRKEMFNEFIKKIKDIRAEAISSNAYRAIIEKMNI